MFFLNDISRRKSYNNKVLEGGKKNICRRLVFADVIRVFETNAEACRAYLWRGYEVDEGLRKGILFQSNVLASSNFNLRQRLLYLERTISDYVMILRMWW